MTEQEAELCVAYMTKVWSIRSGSRWRLSEQGARPDHRKHLLRFSGWVCDDVKLRVNQLYEEDTWTYVLFHEVEGQQSGEFLRFHHDELLLGAEGDEVQEERARQFAEKWLPFFRRGCWLMGRGIGATAQEKDAWCADFEPGELQAWNVRFGPDDLLNDDVIVREAQRFAEAFGIERWRRTEELAGQWRQYSGRVRGVSVKWRHLWDGNLYYCLVSDSLVSVSYVPLSDQLGTSMYSSHQSCVPEIAARGLFRFGADTIIERLNYSFSAHEKLELRLSLPREFWPKTWLEEAKRCEK